MNAETITKPFPAVVGPAKYPDGKFAPVSDFAAVMDVIHPNGVRSWRVGPNGRMYANREHAIKEATRKLHYYGASK